MADDTERDASDRPGPDGLTEEQIRAIAREEAAGYVADELDGSDLPVSRRQVLGALGATAVVGGATGGAAGATSSTGGSAMSVGAATPNTFVLVQGDGADEVIYRGAAAARSELVSELGSNAAGAKYLGDDNGHLYHWNGSGWDDLGRFNTNNPVVDSITTEELFTEARGPSVTVHVKSDGTIVADGPSSRLASGDINTPADVTS
ncbi:MAG: hypothetical protein ACNS61_07490, partial [Candidatus Wenzhouxiangella sp. M2_3B_020]